MATPARLAGVGIFVLVGVALFAIALFMAISCRFAERPALIPCYCPRGWAVLKGLTTRDTDDGAKRSNSGY